MNTSSTATQTRRDTFPEPVHAATIAVTFILFCWSAAVIVNSRADWIETLARVGHSLH